MVSYVPRISSIRPVHRPAAGVEQFRWEMAGIAGQEIIEDQNKQWEHISFPLVYSVPG